MARKATEIVPIMLRLRESLRRQLEQAATKNERSLNAEVIDRLIQSFRNEDQAQLIKETAQATAEATMTLLGSVPPKEDIDGSAKTSDNLRKGRNK